MKARRWWAVWLLVLLTVPTWAQACDYGSGGGSSSGYSGSQGKGGGY
ncbi:hypothetical protein [Burkholderia ubonensis]|nr:hypothetical protein [Burkholderia ubonensis]